MSVSPSDHPRRPLDKHAVVIGGSIGGLLAARVLGRYFERVTVVERDHISDDFEPRQGVPQGAHVHVIFGGGVRVIERLFPGIFAEMTNAGAVVCDFAKDLCWYHHGVWKLRTVSDLTSYWQSRPFLEAHIRRRARMDPNVTLLQRCEVVRLVSNSGNSQITGVAIQHRDDGGREEPIKADLVVDAAGRASRTPLWLEALGLAKPEETTVEINIGYASRTYQQSESATRDWRILATYATPPYQTRTGYIFPIEGGRWQVTAVGFLEDYPPDDDEGFLNFAQGMETPDFFEAIKDARPLSPISTYRFPMHRWRHYERLSSFPDGLIVLGDAICSFNPVYGQGMSTCALEVDLLDRKLEAVAERGSVPAGFSKDFFRAAAVILADPWRLATLSDFLYPHCIGKRPFGTGLFLWYLIRVLRLCATSELVLLRFYRVIHMLDRPTVLMRPAVMLQVLRSLLRPS